MSAVLIVLVRPSAGYGHSTPATNVGKVFTLGYASLGIPIAMIMFQVQKIFHQIQHINVFLKEV
jgi:hypothetical protein